MHPSQVLSRALNTHNYKKDVTETGGVRERNPTSILTKAQDSLYSSKTGLRRLFGSGGSSKELVVPTLAPDEPETLEISEPTRQQQPPATEDMAARLAKVRRSSMTTYTVNLGGAATGQVEREVRRLAGLAPAFTRSTPTNEVHIAHAASFDAVEEMGASPSTGTGAGDGTGLDAEADVGAVPPRQRSQTLFTPGVGGRGPVKTAFSAGGGDPFRISCSGESVPRSSIEVMDVTAISSPYNQAAAAAAAAAAQQPPPSRPGRPPSLPQAFVGSAGVAAAVAAAAGGGSASGGASLSASPVTPGSQLVGQLGLMKDRKAFRNPTNDGLSPGASSGGPNSPATPGGVAVGGDGSVAGSGPNSGTPISVLKLPTLPSTPGRAPSGSQLGGGVLVQALAFSTTSIPAAADSRPGSSRLLLTRGGTTNNLQTATSGAAGPVYRRSSVGTLELSAGSSSGGPRPGMEGGAPGAGAGGGAGAGVPAAASGGRWFQQDTEDVEAMLAGNDEFLEQLMMDAGGGGELGQSPPGRLTTVTGTGDGTDGLLLPRLADAGVAPDRATAQLQELWRVQATVEDQLARDRQAMAAGRARRASLLEDMAGQHQPRWQVSYNVDAPVTHAKLGTVDASRRSELDRAHLAKFSKEQKVPAPPALPASTVSPVVARARRLSTVMVA